MTEQEIRECGIPEYMVAGVLMYIKEGVCGDFLHAVMANNLYEAFARADLNNGAAMRNWALLLERMPRSMWGSKEAVQWHQLACAERRRKNAV